MSKRQNKLKGEEGGCRKKELDKRDVGGAMTEVVRVAEYTRKGRGDLEHWSAMSWGGHWRQRIAVEIVRGLARCVERSATGTRSGGKSKSLASSDQEWHADCLH